MSEQAIYQVACVVGMSCIAMWAGYVKGQRDLKARWQRRNRNVYSFQTRKRIQP